jgi:hypothetical protein
VSFTIANALARLSGSKFNMFLTQNGVMSNVQQLQRLNEVLEKFYDRGDWRGVHQNVSLTSVSGVITLTSSYLRLDGLGIPANNFVVPIKNMAFAYQVGGPMIQDWTNYGKTIAIDMGENSSGLRQYQITGSATANDALTFSGLARRRFNWITDTSTVVVPDCFGALQTGVRAMAAEDENDIATAKELWSQAFAELDDNHEEFEAPQSSGILQLDPLFTAARIPNIL